MIRVLGPRAAYSPSFYRYRRTTPSSSRAADGDGQKTKVGTGAGMFNEIVREHTQAMEIGDRYREIAEGFNSIRDDAKKMVDQIADAKLERVNNIWMKIARGDIAARFEDIKEAYLDVTRSTKDQIQRESAILEAYQDFRGALKQAEILALDVLKLAGQKLEAAAWLTRQPIGRSPRCWSIGSAR
jgi:hypothetical protein